MWSNTSQFAAVLVKLFEKTADLVTPTRLMHPPQQREPIQTPTTAVRTVPPPHHTDAWSNT